MGRLPLRQCIEFLRSSTLPTNENVEGAFDKVGCAGRQIAFGALENVTGECTRDIRGATVREVQGNDGKRLFVLPLKKIVHHRVAVGALWISLDIGATEGPKVASTRWIAIGYS